MRYLIKQLETDLRAKAKTIVESEVKDTKEQLKAEVYLDIADSIEKVLGEY